MGFMRVNIKGHDNWFIDEDGRVFHGKKEIHPYKGGRTRYFNIDGKKYSLLSTVYNTFNGEDVDGRSLYFANGDYNDYRVCNIKKCRLAKEPRREVKKQVRKKSYVNDDGKVVGHYRRVYCEETGKTYRCLKECYTDLGISAITASYAIYSTMNGARTKWHIWDVESEPQTEEDITK